MPQSLSGRCHTELPLWKPYCSLQFRDEAALQMPTAFHWGSLRRHQILKPRSISSQQTRHLSPAPEEKGEAERDDLQETAGASTPEDEKKMRVTRFLTRVAQISSWWSGNTDPGGNGQVVYHSSFHSGPNRFLMARCWKKRIQFVLTSGWYSHSKGVVCSAGWSNLTLNTRLRRSAYTFIAVNIACFDLIQLSCLPTGKVLKFSGHKNKSKATERRKQKEKLANDHCIFTGVQSFV